MTQLRKMEDSEIKRVAWDFAEIFKDYKSYDLFFKRDRFQKRKIYRFFRCEVFEGADYTYIYGDFEAICTVKKPADKQKERDMKKLFHNPFFLIPFFSVTGLKAAKLALEYMRFTDEIAKKFYNPETDCYIKNIGVKECCRGQGILKAMIAKICGDMPIYLETHSADNVKIYRKLGFEVVSESDFHGETHYAMKRPKISEI